MHQTETPLHEGAILARLAGLDETTLSADAAQGLLTLGFSPADKERMHELATKAQASALTPKERLEVEAYSRISSLLGILKSKARRALKHHGSNGETKTR